MAPIATSYLAQIGSVPAGLRAQMIDGDQRLMLTVPARLSVIVLDNRGAPYLRFSAAGVAVNHRSALYFENQTPVALAPPPGLTSASPPQWVPVSHAHSYQWHEGRLHALASVALRPGAPVVGDWSVPLRVSGRATSISGIVLHRPRPPLVWFWPVVVLLACLPALWRLRDDTLDGRITAALLWMSLAAVAAAAAALELHGRPGITAYQLVKLGVAWALCAWTAGRLIRGRLGAWATFLVGTAAVWAGVQLIPVLRDGFVLAALPDTVTRIDAVLCLAGGIALIVAFVRTVERGSRADRVADAAQAETESV